MGNCGAKPKTNEGLEPIEEEPVMMMNHQQEEEQKNKGKDKAQEQNNVDTINNNNNSLLLEEIPNDTNAYDDKSLHNIIDEKKEEAPKWEGAGAEAEVVKLEVVEPRELKVIQEEIPSKEEPKIQAY